MRWPWSRATSQDQLVVSWSGQVFSYARARIQPGGQIDVRQIGVERQGTDSLEELVSRLKAQGFGGLNASIMLRPEQCQVLQIASPAVAPEELRSAARYQIREMVDVHIDDLTLDVMHVGDGQDKSSGQMFVVTATNAIVREVMSRANTMQWPVTVIDIQEMAQRNLQFALAQRAGTGDRAEAALILTEERQAVLTISAKGELYYTRRLDLPPGFMSMAWGHGAEATTLAWAWSTNPVRLRVAMTRTACSGWWWKFSARWTCGTAPGPASHWAVFAFMPASAPRNWRLGWPAKRARR
ncbi:MAG: hypothetical protein RL081_2157 [Pseudomonadota bacterium]